MKIKTFTAETVREALAQVRQELGGEAVILDNQPCNEGVKILAAVDFDEAVIRKIIEKDKSQKEKEKQETILSHISQRDATEQMKVLQLEVSSLRDFIMHHFHDDALNELKKYKPVQLQILKHLRLLGSLLRYTLH